MATRLISRLALASYSVATVLTLWPQTATTGTCHHAYAVEGQTPPVFTGINTANAGFVARYWAWGANPSNQGTQQAGLVDDDFGIALNSGILWSNSDNCAGEIEGTGILMEAQTTEAGGWFALLAVNGAEGNVDVLQAGGTQCTAQAIPHPTVTGFALGTDGFGVFADVTISWIPPIEDFWAVSTISPVLAGYGVYYRTGNSVDNGDKSFFGLVGATPDGSAPYAVDDSDTADGLLPVSQTSCTVRIRPGHEYYFALSIFFDGSGATSGDPQADASAVETVYVSACSEGVAADNEIFTNGFDSGSSDSWSDAWETGLDVTAAALHSGPFGLEVSVGSPCTSPEYLDLNNQTVSGSLSSEACFSIVAGDNFVVASGGDATFTAGYLISLKDGFSVESGGSFSAGTNPPLNPFTYVQDDSPVAETTYNAEFFINLDNVTLGAAAEISNFIAYANGNESQFRLVVKNGPLVALEVRDDSGTFHSTTNVALVGGWNKVSVNWESSANASASLTVNSGTPQTLTGLGTDQRRIDFVRWGAIAGTVDGSTGTIYLDDFSSWR